MAHIGARAAQLEHRRGMRPFGIAGTDGVDDFPVVRQRALDATIGRARGDLEDVLEQALQGPAHLQKHLVVAGAQQAKVEGVVVRDVDRVVAIGHRLRHAVVGRFQVGNFLRRGAAAGQAHRLRLDDRAQLLQIVEQLRRKANARLPVDHVTIEPVPALGRLDDGADLGTGADQALGHQRFDRFAQDGARDPQHFTQFLFRGQLAARGIVPPDQRQSQGIQGAAVDVFDVQVRHSGTGVASA